MIPNVFHFVFGLREQTEPFHLMYYLCLASCLEVNRPDAVCLHYQHEPWGEWWERIRPHLVLRRISPDASITAHTYDDPVVARFRYAHLADVARLQILLDEGGVYADIDTLFLRPIPEEWRTRQFILGHETPPPAATHSGSLCNAWMASAPGAEFGRRWLEQLPHAFDGSWSNHSTLLPYRLWQQYPHLIDVQPASAFYALDWTPRGIADIFWREVTLPADARSLHLWNHLWFSPDRLDFSHFHEGLLTADYVRHARTTYARHARRVLPPDVSSSRSTYTWQAAASAMRHPWRTARLWMVR
jgi:hypothetical protein